MSAGARAGVAVARARRERLVTNTKACARAAVRQAKRKWIKDVLEEFDTSHSGGLNFEEIRSWLSRVDTSREHDPTDLEVKWVIQMATPDKQEFNGEWTSFKRQLKGDGLRKACEHWMMYIETYDEISEKENRVRQGIDVEMAIQVFSKYDEDHTDTLSKDQMARVLQDLNHGVAVEQEEIDAIIDRASQVVGGSITRPGLIKAVSLWYALEDEKLAREETLRQQQAMSACCSLQ